MAPSSIVQTPVANDWRVAESVHNLSKWETAANDSRRRKSETIQAWTKSVISRPVPSLPPSGQTNVKLWPLECGHLTSRQVTITESNPTRILASIASGTWTAEEVFLAFLARTLIAHYLTNPLAEPFFERGLKRARDLDQYLQIHGKPIGSLHGLPISLKDVMNVEGTTTTFGFVAFAGRKLDNSDDLITKLHEAGAVFYTKTNVPQGLLSGECSNHLFGRTSTPYNTRLSAGGSSGGEGSLIALGGSPLGIGTDIAGSIRTPANFNGVYGLCPSYGRWPIHGPRNNGDDLVVRAVAGPLSRTLDGLEVFTKSVLELKPWEWDATCVPIPWSQKHYEEFLPTSNRKLSVGIVSSDGIITPHPPILRGLSRTTAALRDAGHEVIESSLFDGTEGMWELLTLILCSTGDQSLRNILDQTGEPLVPGTLMPPSTALSAAELQTCGQQIKLLQQRFLDKWRETAKYTSSGRPVDVFILPSGGTVAPPHDTMDYWLYEAISNILDWTCATIPICSVDLELDKPVGEEDFNPLSNLDTLNWRKCKFVLQSLHST
jgi:amidase